jgi:N-methylhydantoinase A
MLLADRVRDYAIGALGVSDFEARFRKLEKQARQDMRGATLERFADIRYAGQSYELTVPWGGDFHAEHQRVYGYSDINRVTQIVTLRVRSTVAVPRPKLTKTRSRSSEMQAQRRVWVDGRWRLIPATPRESLGKMIVKGPALITDYGSTTLVPNGWTIRLDSAGSLILNK